MCSPRLLLAGLLPVLLVSCSSAGSPRHLAARGALGPYSAAVLCGDFCFVAGQIAGQRGGPFREEADGALDSVEAQLRRAGLGLGDVVSATVYLTDLALYGELNEVYARRLPAPYPARACVAVKELPGGARVEIQVIARRRR